MLHKQPGFGFSEAAVGEDGLGPVGGSSLWAWRWRGGIFPCIAENIISFVYLGHPTIPPNIMGELMKEIPTRMGNC